MKRFLVAAAINIMKGPYLECSKGKFGVKKGTLLHLFRLLWSARLGFWLCLTCWYLAERVGFEPTNQFCRLHTFQEELFLKYVFDTLSFATDILFKSPVLERIYIACEYCSEQYKWLLWGYFCRASHNYVQASVKIPNKFHRRSHNLWVFFILMFMIYDFSW